MVSLGSHERLELIPPAVLATCRQLPHDLRTLRQSGHQTEAEIALDLFEEQLNRLRKGPFVDMKATSELKGLLLLRWERSIVTRRLHNLDKYGTNAITQLGLEYGMRSRLQCDLGVDTISDLERILQMPLAMESQPSPNLTPDRPIHQPRQLVELFGIGGYHRIVSSVTSYRLASAGLPDPYPHFHAA